MGTRGGREVATTVPTMLPAWLEAVILGVVQGLTEFIPVSSSGHLVLVPYLLGWEKSSLAFDVMLHVGTLGAVLVYFRRELIAMLQGLLGIDRSEQGRIYRRVALFIIPASVPIGIVGLTLEEQVADAFASPLVPATSLLLTAALLVATEKVRDRRVAGATVSVASPVAADGAAAAGAAADEAHTWEGDWRAGAAVEGAEEPATTVDLPLGEDPADPAAQPLSGLTLRAAMVAGLVQCLALLPGVSRSGSTIAGGVFAGLTREAATRFSFLLAIPALVGATILSLPDLAEGGETAVELVGGALAAFVSGYAAVRFLVALVSRERLTGFAIYCVAASIIGFVGYAMLGPISSV